MAAVEAMDIGNRRGLLVHRAGGHRINFGIDGRGQSSAGIRVSLECGRPASPRLDSREAERRAWPGALSAARLGPARAVMGSLLPTDATGRNTAAPAAHAGEDNSIAGGCTGESSPGGAARPLTGGGFGFGGTAAVSSAGFAGSLAEPTPGDV